MAFWIAILAGALFVWLAVRRGFYETWVLFVNVVISIYLAIFLAPILAELAPAPGSAASYHMALCLLVLAGGGFALLEGLSYVFLTAQYHIPFPRLFDIVLSGLVGFGTGFLTLTFLALVLTTTSLAENKIAGVLGLGRQSRQINVVCLTRCCDVIHSFARFDEVGNTAQAAVQKLLEVPKVSPRPPEENPNFEIRNSKQTQNPKLE